MGHAEMHLPFARSVAFRPPFGGGPRQVAVVVDDLPVCVEEVRGATCTARMWEDGGEGASAVVHGGRAYATHAAPWAGKEPDEAAESLRGLHRERSAGRPALPPGGLVVDDGRKAQEAARLALESDAILVDGVLHARFALPSLAVVARPGVVVVEPTDGRPGRQPAWLTFALDREDEACEMAGYLAGLLRFRDGTEPGSLCEASRGWTLRDPGAFHGLRPADGGPLSRDEVEAAMATDLVDLLAPHVGHYPDPVLVGFMMLRQAAAGGADVRARLDALASEMGRTRFPGGGDAGVSLALAAHCVRRRLAIADEYPEAEAASDARPDEASTRRAMGRAARAMALLRDANPLNPEDWRAIAVAVSDSGVDPAELGARIPGGEDAVERWASGHAPPAPSRRGTVVEMLAGLVEARLRALRATLPATTA